MFDNSFYHELVRKTVVSFGTLFNNLYISRTNNQGVITQRMKVPLAYGPKQKFLVRLEQNPDLMVFFDNPSQVHLGQDISIHQIDSHQNQFCKLILKTV